MAYTLLQTASAHAASVITLNAILPRAVQAGDLLVAAVRMDNTFLDNTVSDATNGAWTKGFIQSPGPCSTRSAPPRRGR